MSAFGAGHICRVKAQEIVNGYEIASGALRIHDPAAQRSCSMPPDLTLPSSETLLAILENWGLLQG